jgi:hypothetical protein
MLSDRTGPQRQASTEALYGVSDNREVRKHIALGQHGCSFKGSGPVNLATTRQSSGELGITGAELINVYSPSFRGSIAYRHAADAFSTLDSDS